MSKHSLSFIVNEENVAVEVESRSSLLDCLREQLGFKGAHAGCEHGVCGACNVLVDGQSVRSCLMLAVQANGRNVLTVEGLNKDSSQGELGPLQEAFRDRQALQCGYCTPGMLIRAHEILTQNPHSTADQIREHLASNLCRCTGYEFIVEAILTAAESYQ
ncbi:MAG: (2Fe-2S)-binding protein [Pseudomonadota bacterium]